MTYDNWKTTEPEEKPTWKEKGYKSKLDYLMAVDLGIEDMDVVDALSELNK